MQTAAWTRSRAVTAGVYPGWWDEGWSVGGLYRYLGGLYRYPHQYSPRVTKYSNIDVKALPTAK